MKKPFQIGILGSLILILALGFQNCAEPLSKGETNNPSTDEGEKQAFSGILTDVPLHIDAASEFSTGFLGLDQITGDSGEQVFHVGKTPGTLISAAVVPINSGRSLLYWF